MNRDEALRKIDDLINVVMVSIPEEIEIDGKVYRIKNDILQGKRDEMLQKYEEMYEKIRNEIETMEDVPEELVYKALVLRRTIIFLREFKGGDDIEDKKRWLEYIKKVSR